MNPSLLVTSFIISSCVIIFTLKLLLQFLIWTKCLLFLICYHTFRKITYFVHSDYHCHPETIVKIIAAIKIVTISTREILVFLRFDSMIIMLVGEFDNWRIVFQFVFQPVVCFVRDKDGMQGWATRKHIAVNAHHGVGDGDGLQGWAIIKRTEANAGHGVGDDKIFSLW